MRPPPPELLAFPPFAEIKTDPVVVSCEKSTDIEPPDPPPPP